MGGTLSIDYQFEDDPVINKVGILWAGDIRGAFLKIREKSGEKDVLNAHAAPIWQGKRMWTDIKARLNNNIDNQLQGVSEFIRKVLNHNPNAIITIK